MAIRNRTAPGVTIRHAKKCPRNAGKKCRCTPAYRAKVSVGRRDEKRQYLTRTFDTLAEAVAWIDEAKAAIDGVAPPPGEVPTIRIAWDDFIERAEAGTVYSRAGKPYSPATIDNYESAVENHVLTLRLGGQVELGSLRADVLLADRRLQQVVNQIATGSGTPEVARLAGSALSAMLRDLYDRGVLPSLPPRIARPAPAPRRERVLTAGELAALVNAARRIDHFTGMTVALLVATGMRISEACSLTWGDIDFDEERPALDVRASKTEHGIRRVYLPDEVATMLKRYRMACGRPGPEAYVLTTKAGEKCSRDGRPRTAIREAAKNAGIEGVTAHVLRHTHASHLAAAGADAAALAKRMGHRDAAFTLRRYVMPLDDSEVALAKMVKVSGA